MACETLSVFFRAHGMPYAVSEDRRLVAAVCGLRTVCVFECNAALQKSVLAYSMLPRPRNTLTLELQRNEDGTLCEEAAAIQTVAFAKDDKSVLVTCSDKTVIFMNV